MPKNYSLSTLTDDILREVEEGQQMQKTAADLSPEYKSEIAQQVVKLAQELRYAANSGEVSYEDLESFLEKQAGLGDWARAGKRYVKLKARGLAEKFKLKSMDTQAKVTKHLDNMESNLPMATRKAQQDAAASTSGKVKPWHVVAGGTGLLGAGAGAYYLGGKLGEK